MPLPPFKNEPILELRRAPIRAQLKGALEAFDDEPVVQVPVWVGEDTRQACIDYVEANWTDMRPKSLV